MHKNNKATLRRSLVGSIIDKVISVAGIRKKLGAASYQKLHSFEDARTPIKRGYHKEIIGTITCFWIGREKKQHGVLVFLPGGGFIIGPSVLHWDYCEKMSKLLNMAVLVVRYSLAPEHPFPQGLHDVVAAIEGLQQRNILQKKWFLAGDSAGGNLAIAACYLLHEKKLPLPHKIILLYPALDLSNQDAISGSKALQQKDKILSNEFSEKVNKAYIGSNDARNPLISPLFGDVNMLPPVLLQHGTQDLLLQGSRSFVAKMQAAGKPILYEEYEGIFHGFAIMPGLPEAKKAIKTQVDFLLAD